MLRPRIASVAAGLTLALGLPLAAAQEQPKKKPADDTLPLEGAKQRREGEYGGVKPGERPRAEIEAARPARRPRAGTLSWVGFSADNDVGHLFIQAPTEFGYSQRVEGRILVVHLTGIKRLARNVRRPLDTRFFDSPVTRVAVKKVRAKRARKGQPKRPAGVEVRIAFRTAGDAREAAARTALEADGYFYLYLDLAPGGSSMPVEPEPERVPE